MSAANTDNFMQVAVAGSETTLTAPGKAIGANNFNLTSPSGWPTGTGIIVALRRVDSNGVYVPGTYTEWAGVVSGSNVAINTSPLYGTDQTYAADGLTQAYIPVSASLWNRFINALLADHLQNGGHSVLHDTNNNVILRLNSIANAVNDIKVGNSITGINPTITAEGSDSDSGIDIVSKGNGISRIDGAAPKQFAQNAFYNFVESGCVWSGDSYGSTKNASMTSGVVWIAGKRLTVAAITAHAFTASKDTYVDFQDNGDGTASVTYTEATNNAASVAIPNSQTDATNIRNAIIITGASSIANSGSVNQGQETIVLPIASSVPYAVTDSLGNLICPRDPNRKILGQRIITTSPTATTIAQATGLSIPFNIPTGRKIRVRLKPSYTTISSVGDMRLSAWDGTVGSGTQVGYSQSYGATTNVGYSQELDSGAITLAAGFHTINIGIAASAGTITLGSLGATGPTIATVELE